MLDPLTVLIRETAQNSCDAAIPSRDVDYSLQLNRLSGNRLSNWREYLLPEPTASGLGIGEILESEPLILTICDRGTTGLGGPVRADSVRAKNERPDFVNFIRNVGERKGVVHSGGSYGFGKGILYNLSKCHVIVADSICINEGRRERRLIAAALGDGFEHDGSLNTGRHWLGPTDWDGVPMPLINAEADEMAALLGLPSFDSDATGTSVVIVGMDLGLDDATPRTPERAAEFMVSAILWNLWPRMLPEHSSRLRCAIKCNGFNIPVPDPEDVPALAPFIESWRALSKNGQFEVPERRTPPRDIGRFALTRGIAPPVQLDPNIAAAAPFPGRAHHCARMRQADLIVDYMAGPAPESMMVQYGAVFRSSREADAMFAEAEPPTHDTWVTDGLSGSTLGVVQLSRRFINDRLSDADSGNAGQHGTGIQQPLGRFAHDLSSLVATARGDSATAFSEGNAPSAGGGTGRRGEPVRIVEGPSLAVENGTVVVKARVQLPPEMKDTNIEAVASIVTETGVEPGPTVIGWTSTAGGDVRGNLLSVSETTDREWIVRVLPVPDTVTRLKLRTYPS